MFATLFNQLPEKIQLRTTILATWMRIDSVFLFALIIWVLVYVIILLILVQVHENIIKRRKNTLETYTFIVDKVIYEIQKWIYNNTIDSTDGERIKDRDSSKKYISISEKIQEYAEKVSPDLSKSVDTNYRSYANIKSRENILGYVLVIVTIWAYKFVW